MSNKAEIKTIRLFEQIKDDEANTELNPTCNKQEKAISGISLIPRTCYKLPGL